MGDILHQWTIKEYDQHERGVWWHVITITLAIVLVGYGLWTDNFMFSLIIILGAIILYLQSYQPPQKLPFAITELGIAVGNRFYTYHELTAFYIVYQPPRVKTLFLETKSSIRPRIRVPLTDQHPVEIRHTLQEFLEEDLEVEEEPTSDMIAREWKLH